jgi:hypothetical protein
MLATQQPAYFSGKRKTILFPDLEYFTILLKRVRFGNCTLYYEIRIRASRILMPF